MSLRCCIFSSGIQLFGCSASPCIVSEHSEVSTSTEIMLVIVTIRTEGLKMITLLGF